MRKTIVFAVALLLAFSVACNSSDPKPAGDAPKPEAAVREPEKPKAPEYETGRTAFQKLYISARSFAADAKPYRLQSEYTEGAPSTEGKASMWRAQFASPSRLKLKAYSWSGLPDGGVSAGSEDTYNPNNASTRVFEVPFLKVDSDKAFEVAQKNGGEKITKKNPEQPITYLLDFNPRGSRLVWHVIYGESASKAQLRLLVDATTGQFIGRER